MSPTLVPRLCVPLTAKCPDINIYEKKKTSFLFFLFNGGGGGAKNQKWLIMQRIKTKLLDA